MNSATDNLKDSAANSEINSKANSSDSLSNDSNNSSAESHHYESELFFLIKNNGISAVAFGLDVTRRATQQKLQEKACLGSAQKHSMAPLFVVIFCLLNPQVLPSFH